MEGRKERKKEEEMKGKRKKINTARLFTLTPYRSIS
jgi:hypothetical protein